MNKRLTSAFDVFTVNYCYHGTSQLYHGLLCRCMRLVPFMQFYVFSWVLPSGVHKTAVSVQIPSRVTRILLHLTRRNGLVNQVEFLKLAHTFATVSPNNIQNFLCQTCS